MELDEAIHEYCEPNPDAAFPRPLPFGPEHPARGAHGSGKTIVAELAMFRVFRERPKAKVVYIAPLKALVRERISDWRNRMENQLGKKVVELTGDVSPDARAIAAASVIVTTPEKWDGVSRSWQTRNFVQDVALIVIDEIHLLVGTVYALLNNV